MCCTAMGRVLERKGGEVMRDEGVSRLVASTNQGRYACDDAVYGRDLTCGDRIAVLIGGHWVKGMVDHSHEVTWGQGEVLGTYVMTGVDGIHGGYYFLSRTGEVCGLCVGMLVRLLGRG